VIWLAVAVAGALGAVCRYVLDYAVSARTGGVFPWGTLIINVTGSLLAGVVAGLAARAVVPVDLQVVVAGGFLGAYTTFSTAMYESMRLAEDGARAETLANLLVPLVLSVTAAAAGWALTVVG
jgi:fluoride exporter